ncbi:MAG TPA: T9SS type A sorting domain-containing protein [Flavobacteriales bacterium]|nr:T9SS type A sorting domain-containing protein [Flavobacteriales bacterium]
MPRRNPAPVDGIMSARDSIGTKASPASLMERMLRSGRKGRKTSERNRTMNRLCRLALVAAIAGCAGAPVCGQNLVPNPSFEDYTICTPDSVGTFISDAVDWLSYSRTPDYLSGCRGNSCAFCTPDNTIAWQEASHGQAYAGIVCYFDQESYREMIGVQLLQPLVVGVQYFGSMKVNCGAEKPEQGTDVFISNKLGMLFTNQDSGLPDGPDEWFELRNSAQIVSEDILSDTATWVTVSGSFTADSAYQYLVIGNHFDNDHTDVIQLVPKASGHSYYFIDEVCVSPDPQGCPLANGIASQAREERWLWPNPANDRVRVGCSGASKLSVFDAQGKLVHDAMTVGDVELFVDVSNWSPGLYTAVFRQDQEFRSMRFMVVH